jgi:prevent-host-death family protein
MKIVTARELKNRTGKVISEARAGEEILVTVRGEPAATIVSARTSQAQRTSLRPPPEAWRDIDETLSKTSAEFKTYMDAMDWARKRK